MYKLNGLDCGGWQVKGADAVDFSMACKYVVRRVNEAAERMVAPGVRFCDIDRCARTIIEDAKQAADQTQASANPQVVTFARMAVAPWPRT